MFEISPVLKVWFLILALCFLGIIANTLVKEDKLMHQKAQPQATTIPTKITLNPDVTQDTIEQTICVSGYTKTVRPNEAYTHHLKLKMLYDRGEQKKNARLYELDHWIPLTLGGAPSDPNNLVLQPWPDAKLKDKDEFKLGKCVCAHGLTLQAAQALMSTWKHPLPDSTYANCPNVPNSYK